MTSCYCHCVQKMFDNATTGFLPLSLVAHVDCKDDWLPEGEIPQIYSLLTNSFCPPEGFTAAYQGQFLVSKARIQAQNWWVYKYLLVSSVSKLFQIVDALRVTELFGMWSQFFCCQVIKKQCPMQDILAAPLDHWVHNVHNNDFYKDRSNPFFGEPTQHMPEYTKRLQQQSTCTVVCAMTVTFARSLL